MADELKLTVGGLRALAEELAKLAPDLRRGPAARALRAGAQPVLQRAIAETPQLSADIFKRGKMIRRAGTLKRALKIRASKDVNRTGDVGVFINYKPLAKSAIQAFKDNTARNAADNPDDPYYFRWVIFSTKRNNKPKRALQISGEIMLATSLPLIEQSLSEYFTKLNSKAAK